MKSCLITITTTVDGQETTMRCQGEIEFLQSSLRLCYQNDVSKTVLQLYDTSAEMHREGDYTLALRLEKGKRSEGSIGIGGAAGGIGTYTHNIQYTCNEKSCLALLHYQLIMGEEKQEMRVRIHAKIS